MDKTKQSKQSNFQINSRENIVKEYMLYILTHPIDNNETNQGRKENEQETDVLDNNINGEENWFKKLCHFRLIKGATLITIDKILDWVNLALCLGGFIIYIGYLLISKNIIDSLLILAITSIIVSFNYSMQMEIRNDDRVLEITLKNPKTNEEERRYDATIEILKSNNVDLHNNTQIRRFIDYLKDGSCNSIVSDEADTPQGKVYSIVKDIISLLMALTSAYSSIKNRS